MCRNIGFLVLFLPALLPAQQKSDLQQVLDRLDRIEQENKDLSEQVRALRAELAASRATAPAVASTATPATAQPDRAATAGSDQPAPIEERVTVAETRIADQSQSKVEASQ